MEAWARLFTATPVTEGWVIDSGFGGSSGGVQPFADCCCSLAYLTIQDSRGRGVGHDGITGTE